MNTHQFFQAFLSTTLTKEQWTHLAHLRLGWTFVRLYGTWEQALPHVRSGIQALNARINHGVGYHETITVFYLQLIDHRIRIGCPEDDWEAFCQKNPILIEKAHRLIFEYYTLDYLFSETARNNYVAPDIQSVGLPQGCESV